jgi:hypothetical protein
LKINIDQIQRMTDIVTRMSNTHTTTGAGISAAQIVRYAYSPRCTREGTIIEENGNRARVHWTREWFAHRGDQSFSLNVRTWVSKSRLTSVNA